MRITHQMLSRGYIRRMETNLTDLARSNEKMYTGRSFNKGYEDVEGASRALQLRKLIADNERYQSTIRDAQGRAKAAEDSLRNVNKLMINAEDRLVEALNGTMSPEDRQKIAAELEAAQKEVFQIMNLQFSGKYVFSAAGNRDGSAPFSLDDTGNLLYQGVMVDDMSRGANGKPQYTEGGVTQEIPYNAANYVDIGFGYRLDDGGGQIDANTAFQNTYSGVESFGYGVSGEGVPVNAYSLFGGMVESLNNNDMDKLGEHLNAIGDTMEFMLTAITEIGARYVTLEDTQGVLENEYINLVETQNDIEGVDLSKEIIMNKGFERSWLVTLQLGSKILPQSIFDFIR